MLAKQLVLCALVIAAWAQTQNMAQIRPPKVTDPATTQYRYGESGKPLEVQCVADGNPEPIYTWRRNSVTIPQGGVEYITVNSNTGVLRFTALSSREKGTYMCVAQNSLGAASFSPEVHVDVRRVDEFPETGIERSQKGNTYSYAMLLCNYTGEVVGETPSFAWYKKSDSDQLGMDNGRLYIDVAGNLHFTYLKGSDDLGSDQHYKCGIKSKSAIYLGPGIRLQIDEGSSIPTSPVKVYGPAVRAKLYSDAVLECVFSGYDGNTLPTVTWKDPAYVVIPDDDKSNNGKYTISENGRRLTIKNVNITSEGNYHCEGRNPNGASKLYSVTLKIWYTPVWNEGGRPTDQIVAEGQDATFKCSARSLPNDPKVLATQWYVNGKENFMSDSRGKYVVSTDGKQLTVKNLDKETDSLCVQCRVNNANGNTWADACVTVILPINIVRQPPHLKQVISYGDNVDLTVIATSDPRYELIYSWQFKNKTYMDAPPYVTYDPTTHQAHINTSLLTNEEYRSIEGVYHRIVSHYFEKRVVAIEVVLDDGAAASSAAPDFDWWIIGLIFSIICLIIVIALIIFLCYRKAQEGDYNVDKKESGAGYDPEKELKQKNFDDFSPPAYADLEHGDYPDKKSPTSQRDMEYDDVPIGGDDESLAEYGSEDLKYFNDDGSFIGEYQNRMPRTRATESTI